MRASTTLPLAVALALGLVAALLARGLVVSDDARARGDDTRRIVVASQVVGFGAALTTENLREVPWAGEAPIEGTFNSIAELNRDGRRLALVSLQRNEPVLASKVTAPNQRATLSTQIDDGKRAVSVRVDEVRGVAGFILPGDRVDVILTRGETSAQDASAAYADVLLQNAKVLAIDQLANERLDKPAVARAVTLELDVQQAQSVILAQGIGRLSLVLRQTGEALTQAAGRVTAADIGSGGGQASGAAQRAETERQIAELKKAAEQANARAGESSRRMAEAEARMQREIDRLKAAPPPAPAPQVVAAPPLQSTVTVTRDGAKREQYTVIRER